VQKHREGTPREKQYHQLDTYCGQSVFVVFNINIYNLTRAVNERLFYRQLDGKWVRPHDAEDAVVALLEQFVRDQLYELLPRTTPMSQQQLLRGYRGRKLVNYTAGCKRLERKPLTVRDAHLDAFGKMEKLPLKEDEGKMIQRVIQTRTIMYHIELGVFTRKIESDLYKAVDELVQKLSGERKGMKSILKGLNCKAQGSIIFEKWSRFKDPVAIMADAKRFDQSVKGGILQMEHNIYLHCFPNPKDRKRLSWLLRQQFVNIGRGRCKDGILKYILGASRCSGDMNTGLGNCIIMTILLTYYLRYVCGITKFSICNNGDDVFVIVEREDEERVRSGMYNFFFRAGFIMEIEKTVDVIEHISFCQTRPVFDGECWRMVRDVKQSLSKDAISIDPFDSQISLANYLHSVGNGGLSLTGGIPMLQEYYQSMIRNSTSLNPTDRKLKDVLTERDGFYWQRRGMTEKYRPVTDAARVSFYNAFGIMPDVQIYMEEYYRQLVIPWEGTHSFKYGERVHSH